ncbi:MAG TPA: HDOD domain-containing protein [Candidatus Gastranaerophilales bacterium]|nr:HDOD domain-containing protein [Candidatus Gastranaerophilales bacterium]
MNVAGYIISYKTDNEAREHENLLQKQKIEIFCKKNGLNLSQILTEPEESRPDFRPKLIKLLNDLSGSRLSALVVYKFNRLAQEEDIRKWIIDEFKKNKIQVFSVTETFFDTPIKESETKSRSIKLKVRDLPSLPEVVTKVTELVQNPKSSAADLGKIIAHDSGLTSRVLRLVNSAYYGFPKQISSIQHAIMILGFTTIKGLVLSSSIFRIFSPKNNLVNSLDYKKFWKHSLLTAIASKKIYKDLFFEDDDNIFSAAILHDIGKLILDQYDHDNYVNVITESPEPIYANQVLKSEQKHCEITHPYIGNVVAEGWNLPEVLADVIKYHHDPLKSEKYERITTAVYLGNLISQLVLEYDEFSVDVFDENVVNHIGIDEEDLLKTFNELKEEASQLEDLESFFK